MRPRDHRLGGVPAVHLSIGLHVVAVQHAWPWVQETAAVSPLDVQTCYRSVTEAERKGASVLESACFGRFQFQDEAKAGLTVRGQRLLSSQEVMGLRIQS